MARQDPGQGSPGEDWNPQHPHHAEASATAMEQPPETTPLYLAPITPTTATTTAFAFTTTTTIRDGDFLLNCPECIRMFTSRIGLVSHLRIHRQETGEPSPALHDPSMEHTVDLVEIDGRTVVVPVTETGSTVVTWPKAEMARVDARRNRSSRLRKMRRQPGKQSVCTAAPSTRQAPGTRAAQIREVSAREFPTREAANQCEPRCRPESSRTLSVTIGRNVQEPRELNK
ncbi:unnamed protein product [Schistocephalus solidus]|uniref:C2H2-type domain-containing protein n=1 Tax=Schistocephalus solidus TaxID=70667 RepID=A0A183SAF0_SCHSO|nr:unnamed protein product [Schistocephalus solidus]